MLWKSNFLTTNWTKRNNNNINNNQPFEKEWTTNLKIITETQKKSRNWPKKSSQKPHNTVCCGERHCDTITRNKQMKVFRPEIWWYTQTKQQRANERASGNCGKCKCSAVCQTLLCANVINRYLWGCAKALGRWSPPSTDLNPYYMMKVMNITQHGYHSPQWTRKYCEMNMLRFQLQLDVR